MRFALFERMFIAVPAFFLPFFCEEKTFVLVIFFFSVVISPFLFARMVVSSDSVLMTQFLNVFPAFSLMNSSSSASVICEWNACVSVNDSAKYGVFPELWA